DTREHDALRPEIDDHLDVAFAVLERLTPALKGDLPRDQPLEPTLVGAHERLCGHLVVPTVRVHRAEHDVVVEHRPSIEAADIEAKYLSWFGDSGQAQDSRSCRRFKASMDDGRSAGALHQ